MHKNSSDSRLTGLTQRVESSPEQGTRSAWIPEFDGLRAAAVLSVILVHYASAHHSSFSLFNDLAVGNLGVATFYALSAFLLAYLSTYEIQKHGHLNLKRFYMRRCFRIFPLYFTVLAIAFLTVEQWNGNVQTLEASSRWQWIIEHGWVFFVFVANLALAFNYIGDFFFWAPDVLSVTWSISTEEQFYVLFPAIFLLAARWHPLSVVGSLVVLGIVSRYIFLNLPVSNPNMHASGGMYYFTFSYVDTFASGALSGWLAAKLPYSPKWQWPKFFRMPYLGLFLTVAFVGLGIVWESTQWYPYAWYSPFFYTVLGLVLGMLLLWIFLNRDSAVSKFLRSQIMGTIGRLSYGMYLWHLIVLSTVTSYTEDVLLRFDMSIELSIWIGFIYFFVFVLLCSALSYGVIELPFLVLKNLWSGRSLKSERTQETVHWKRVLLVSIGILICLEIVIWEQPPLWALCQKYCDRVQIDEGEGKVVLQEKGRWFFSGDVDTKKLPKDVTVIDAKDAQLSFFAVERKERHFTNVGPWHAVTGKTSGLMGILQNGKWVLGLEGWKPVNENSQFTEGNDENPIPTYWMSPGEAEVTVRKMKDLSGQFVRITANSGSHYMAITGNNPVLNLSGIPVSIRAQIRVSKGIEASLTLTDVVAEPEKAHSYKIAIAPPSAEWISLIVRVPEIEYPDPGDNFAVGIGPVKAGDYFDIRELGVFEGVLP